MKRKQHARSLALSQRRSRASSWVRLALIAGVLAVIGAALSWPGQISKADRKTAPQLFAAQRNVSAVQGKNSPDGVWREIEERAITQSETQRPGRPRSYRSLSLDRERLSATLRDAPLESSDAAKTKTVVLSFPLPNGTFERFRIEESPIMAPELAARFPEIKTYKGQGIDDPTATTRFDWTPQGFHGIVLSQEGTVLIEPNGVGETEKCIVYFQGDVVGGSGECGVTEQDQEAAIADDSHRKGNSQVGPAVSSGTTLRTYRLAAAATAEYTQAYGGGTVNGGLSAITTTMNLVNAIYERDVAIRMVLIAGETSIIFTDTTTDGYTHNDAVAMLPENQAKLDSVIGSANYDIGHVFDGELLGGGFFSWSGFATIGAVCNNSVKARGSDIFRSVSPTSVFAYYSAAHEMGHQFGARHTFNTTSGSCGSGQRSPANAYEPANGSTIMAYRFACAPDDLQSQDTYFHHASIEQIVDFSTIGTGNSCAVQSATGNNPPVVDAGLGYTIPMGTPFILTATGSDPDGHTLTFGWEEYDLGTVAPPNTDDGSRPIFRSFLPTISPSRTFPRLQDVLSGSATFGESLPVTTRTMNFRVTARDNRSAGGGVNSDAMQVSVNSGAGPFTVTQPASAATWPTVSSQTISWNVANTAAVPVSCANVRITLSTDGGNSFPIVLANSTPNDGAENVTIPGTPSGTARVKVESIGNIFFNISQGFTITGTANTLPTITNFSPGSGLPGTSVTIDGTNFINVNSVLFNGVSASFTVNSTTQIVAMVPSGATTGPISVSTASGTAMSSNNFIVPSAPPSIQLEFADYNFSEGVGNAQVHVKRTGDTTGTSSVNFETGNNGYVACHVIGPAVQNCDFILSSGTLSFTAGQTDLIINILINDDTHVEGNETLGLSLSNAVGATLGSPNTATLNIIENDTAGAPSVAPKTFIAALTSGQEVPPTGTGGKGGGVVQLDASETGAKAGLIFSNLSSSQTNAHIHGPAAAGVNAPPLFTLPTGTVIDFALSPAPTTQQVSDLKAGLHYMNVHTSNFTGGEIRGQLLWNPLNEVDYFVRQQYYDFLGRLPDQGGFDFWTDAIKQCGINVQCLREKTVAVSNAFFYEDEYQQTASYVFLLYRASFGNDQPFPNPGPDPNYPGEEKKLPRYLTFVGDRAQVIGGTGLAASQLALANAFVQRPEFVTKYQANTTAESFVDAVLATIQSASGVNLAATDPNNRPRLITHFNNGGRGLVMFHLANDYWNGCHRLNPAVPAPCVPAGFGDSVDNRPLIDAEYNRSFVYSQYSGYLRRDAEMEGFIFWLNQVSTAPPRDGDKQHGMVCAFITSDEYQFRFGNKAPRTNAECIP